MTEGCAVKYYLLLAAGSETCTAKEERGKNKHILAFNSFVQQEFL